MTRSEAGKLGWMKSSEKISSRLKSQRDEYERNPKVCLECPGLISFECRNVQKFCSQSCAAKFRNKNNPWRKPRLKECRRCNTEPRLPNRKHCANCFRPRMLACIEDATTDMTRRRMLIRDGGKRCSVCQLTEWMGKEIPIQLDHIDGNAANNAAINLRLICPNCHAQTPTFAGRNVGRGRPERRARYLKKTVSP